MIIFHSSSFFFHSFHSCDGTKGIPLPDFVDGQSFIKAGDVETVLSSDYSNRQILIEYWGEGDATTYDPECKWKKHDRLSVSVVLYTTSKNFSLFLLYR